MKRILQAAVSAVGLITLAACSSSGSPSHNASPNGTAHGSMSSGMSMPGASMTSAGPAAAGPHNSADVSFATDMIPHHGQAIEMADLAVSKATNPQVKAFATQIKAAQAPEIQKMSGWLAGWGSPVPNASMTAGMPGMAMPGEMSASDMQALNSADGAAFDKMWTEMMIKHHTGAIDMAKTETAAGQNAEAKSLAQSITTSQSTEIGQLRKLLPTLGS